MARRQHINKWLIITLGVTAVAAVGAVAYIKLNHHKVSSPPTTYDTSKPENQQTAVDPKTDTDNAKRQNAATNTTTKSGDVTPQITYFGQSNGTVILDATVDGASSGTCTTVFKNGNATLTKNSAVRLVTSYYACGELQFSSNEFNPKGTWSATVRLDNGPESQAARITVN